MDETGPAVKAVADREAALYAAMIAADYATLNGILSAESTYVHSTGVVETKGDYLAALRRGLYEYGEIRRIKGLTRIFGGAAITCGVIDMLVGAEGGAKSVIRLQHVLVWVEEEGVWRLLLRQATRLPQ